MAGISRVILSRVSIDERLIRRDCPTPSLKSSSTRLCIAYSGRCLLSGYFNHPSGPQSRAPATTRAAGISRPTRPRPKVAATSGLLEEPQKRAHAIEGTSTVPLLNSRICAIESTSSGSPRSASTPSDRRPHQSPYYVARTSQAHRQAIDDACQPAAAWTGASRPTLEGLASRGYRRFLPAPHANEMQNYLRPPESNRSLRGRCGGLRRRWPRRNRLEERAVFGG